MHLQWVALGSCFVLLALSIDANRPLRGTLLDEAGKPVQDAFVTYSYSAGTKLIWPWAYHAGPFLARTGRDGRFDIPWKLRLRFPLVPLNSPVRLLAAVFVPRLHNSCAIIDATPQDSYCARLLSRGGDPSFRMLDLAARPEARFRTLWLVIPAFQAPLAPVAQRRELVAAVRWEYDQFLSEYGLRVFANAPNTWGHIKIDDWTTESGEDRPWSFFLQKVPFYGSTIEEKLSRMERQTR